MKKLLIGTLALITLNSFAQSAGKEGGNGGQTVYQGNNAYLRDLVEKNNCIWKNYQSILTEAPVLKKIINDMAILNSSFSLRMEEEVANLDYCFTTKRLPYLQYNNSDDIHIFSNQEYDQVAINDSGIVFIDVNIFSKMNQENRAYLFIHEAGHGLYDQKEPRSSREPRLREFLMNLFEQLPTLVRTRNYEGFNLLIEKAKFSALENVLSINHDDFMTVFLNSSDISLEEKVKALLNLPYLKEGSKIYSKTLKQNINLIEKDRKTRLETLVNTVNRTLRSSNFADLDEALEEILKFTNLNDQQDDITLKNLRGSLLAKLQQADLGHYTETLKKAFTLINLKSALRNKELRSFPAGYIASNYDAAKGEGAYATDILLNNFWYINVLLFGKVAITPNYTHYFSDTKKLDYDLQYDYLLDFNEKGLINNYQSQHAKYLINESRMNPSLRKIIIEKLENDIAFIEKNNFSYYVNYGSYKIGEVLYLLYPNKKKYSCKKACLSSQERNVQLQLRKDALKLLK